MCQDVVMEKARDKCMEAISELNMLTENVHRVIATMMLRTGEPSIGLIDDLSLILLKLMFNIETLHTRLKELRDILYSAKR